MGVSTHPLQDVDMPADEKTQFIKWVDEVDEYNAARYDKEHKRPMEVSCMMDLHHHPHIVSLAADPLYDCDRRQWRLSMVPGLFDVFDFMLDEHGNFSKFKR